MTPALRCLVTGASGGIGGATARALGADGARLVLQGRDADALAAVAEATGGLSLPADLVQPGEAERLAERAEAALGGVDVLVDCAGAGWAGPFSSMPPERIDELVALDLLAPLRLTRAVVEPMRARGWGRVVLMGSVAGHLGVPGEAAYAAAKGGLVAFAEALRAELRMTGVAVTLVSPAVIATRFFERRAGLTAAGDQPESAGTANESSGAAVPADPSTGRRASPLERRVPRPQPPEAVAEAIVRAVRSPSPPAEVFVPRWMTLPVRLRGAVPALYRRLAAFDPTYRPEPTNRAAATDEAERADGAESRNRAELVDGHESADRPEG